MINEKPITNLCLELLTPNTRRLDFFFRLISPKNEITIKWTLLLFTNEVTILRFFFCFFDNKTTFV